MRAASKSASITKLGLRPPTCEETTFCGLAMGLCECWLPTLLIHDSCYSNARRPFRLREENSRLRERKFAGPRCQCQTQYKELSGFCLHGLNVQCGPFFLKTFEKELYTKHSCPLWQPCMSTASHAFCHVHALSGSKSHVPNARLDVARARACGLNEFHDRPSQFQ